MLALDLDIPPKKKLSVKVERRSRSVWLSDEAWEALARIAHEKGYDSRSEMLTTVLEQMAGVKSERD